MLIAQSGLFDPDWYRAAYPDVGLTGIDPLRHFVKYGADLGRRPGPGFDPAFYAARYPDVEPDAGAPLWHYLQHGRTEGRLPTPEAARTHDGMVRVRRAQAELWGGLEETSEAALGALLDDPDQPEQVRFEAGCQSVFWLDFNGKDGEAQALLERLGGMSAPFAGASARLIPLSLILSRRGAERAATDALAAIRPADRGADRVLALANLATDDGARLELLNTLYAAHDLAPLRRIDPVRPLGLDNIETAPCAAAKTIGKVSVIVPAYEAVDTIDTALRGLCRQSYRDLEIIVVDDASTDGTFDRVKALATNDPRIVPLRQPRNGGAYAARNAGLERATGDFITTHDADDWSHPEKIARQVAALTGDPARIGVIAHWARIRPPLKITSNWRLSPKLLQWSHSSFLFRRAAADRLGGWDAVKVSGDMEYIWRVEAAYGPGSVQRILPDVPLAFALDDAGSLTRNPLTHVRTTYRGLRHYYREICRYWHRQAPGGLAPQQQALKRAMLPAAIWPGQDGSLRADLLIRADCCDPRAVAEMAALAEQAPARQIAVSHRPDPGFVGRRTGYAMEFDETFFDLLRRENVVIACPEEKVEATETLSL
ncbi:glycosyltransferase family 2 protein [Thalassovita mangrovi]|uniref:Glycosyltransferase n=1 Tax=Thalassovita mangrovi TaxID=2692236 RepID=A0A6L8LRT4_9RHOB|nr:glycosyltransferase [Thalassovita mangrovi]